MKKFLRQFNLQIAIIIIACILFITGIIFDLLPPMQVIIRKTFLVAWWYLLAYIFRRFRLGEINWETYDGYDWDKKIYYFVLLIGSAFIIALG